MGTSYRILEGDNRVVLPQLPENYFDALVTDPPAGIEMGARVGKDWDCFRRSHNENDAGRPNAFGRLSRVAPHSYGESDRGAFIDFMTEVASGTIRALKPGATGLVWALPRTSHWTAMALEDAGYEIRDVVTHIHAQGMPKSTALLKPSSEHWIHCRKPGPLQRLRIDDCRVPRPGETIAVHSRSQAASDASRDRGVYGEGGAHGTFQRPGQESGGYPPNILLTPEAAEEMGDRAKFFWVFQSKASRKEKRAGLTEEDADHQTVKPIDLMRFLVRLVTPVGGTVLDPFMGSGTTLIAACLEGCVGVGVERDTEYVDAARKRLHYWVESRQSVAVGVNG